ncbi:hypothetical protein AAHB34_03455 [Paenarthrobacter ureafaciens]
MVQHIFVVAGEALVLGRQGVACFDGRNVVQACEIHVHTRQR